MTFAKTLAAPAFSHAPQKEVNMPKKKTKRGATKRLKMSATGKVLHTRACKAHLNLCKSRKQKRNLRGMKVLSASFQKVGRRMLSA
jgi:large subunit ribosomal protein L35